MPTDTGAPTGPEIVANVRREHAQKRQQERTKRAQKIHKYRQQWRARQVDAEQSLAELKHARYRAESLVQRETVAEREYRGLRVVHRARPGDVFRVLVGVTEVMVAFAYETVSGWSGHAYNDCAKKWDKRVTEFSYSQIHSDTGNTVEIHKRPGGGVAEAAPLFVGRVSA